MDGSDDERSGSDIVCASCGAEELESGFLEEGVSGQGAIRWFVGPLERGVLGGPKRLGRPALEVTGKRCGRCGYLALYAIGSDASGVEVDDEFPEGHDFGDGAVL